MNDNLQNNQQNLQSPENVYTGNYSNNVANEYNNMNSNTNTNSNKKFLAIIIPVVVVIIALVGLASHYFISVNSPLTTYQGMIKKMVNEIYAMTEVDDKFKATSELDLNLKLEEDLLDEEILNLINKTTLEMEVQYDRKDEKAVIKLDSNYDKESLLAANVYLNNKDEELYLYAKEFLDKYLKIEDEDFSVFDVLFEEMTSSQKKNLNKSKKILINELTSLITKEDCYTEDGYHVLKISGEELAERLEKIVENLKENKEFLECFEDEYTVTSVLDSITISYSEDTEIKYAIKKTFFNKIEEVILEVDTMKVVAKFEDDKIEYELKAEGEKVLAGTILINETKENKDVEFVMNIPELGSITINLKTSYTTKFDMDGVNKSKVVSIDELTEDDQNEVMENLQESKLYEIISLFSFGFDDEYDDDYDYDYDYDDDYYGDDYNNSNLSNNSLVLIGSEESVYFEVPNGYVLTSNYEGFKTYKNGDIEVTVSRNYGETADEYLNSLNNLPSYYQDEYYRNVVLSNKMDLNINNRMFYYKEFSFEYVGYSNTTKYYERYYYTQLNEEDSIVVEVESKNSQISNNDLYKFLNITYY